MILRENHELFKAYYGESEYERLKPIFETEPKELTRGSTWVVPNVAQAETLQRFIMVAGVGSIKFLQNLCSDEVVCKQIKTMILLENDPEVISHLINHPHFKVFITHPNVKLLFNVQEENLKPLLFRIMKEPNFSEVMELGGVYYNQTEPNENLKNFYSHIDSYLRETVEHIYNNYGRICDSLDGVRATFMNSDKIFDCDGIENLKNYYKGKPFVVCGAGPSLDKAIPHLKEHREKFVLIAADAAVKPLMAAGITPNYATSIERLNGLQKPFWDGLDPKTCELICFPVVHPDVLKLFKGKIRIVYRNYAYYAYFQKSWPKGLLHCGGSTSNLAVRLAEYMGASEIVLAGIDHAYEKEGDLYRSHCSNTGYPLWSEWHPIDYFRGPERNHAPHFTRPGNSGEEVMTNYTYYLWSKEFAEEAINLNIKITDTAEHGVKMECIPYRPAQEIFKEWPEQKIEQAPAGGRNYFRKWDHTVLEKSVKGWIRTAKGLIKILNEGPMDLKHMKWVGDLYNLKFVREDLFISFVVQNCAVEYYKLQNEFNSLDGGEASLPKYWDIMKRRMEVFLSVLEPLNEMIEQHGKLKEAS